MVTHSEWDDIVEEHDEPVDYSAVEYVYVDE